MLKKSLSILILVFLYSLSMKRLLWLLWRSRPAKFRYLVGVVFMSRQFYKQDKFPLSFSFCRGPKHILCVNDRINGHGLTDRIRGMVSLYAYCKERSLNYGIIYTHPFQLIDYLRPNEYDWTRNEEYYNANTNVNCALICEYPMSTFGWSSELPKDEIRAFEKWIMGIYTSLPIRTLQLVTNVSFTDRNSGYGELYQELFSPTDVVSKTISQYQQRLGKDYISVSYRFINLLGDSEEHISGFQPLNNMEANKLISQCKEQLHQLCNRNNCSVLVTSDSYRFLSSISLEEFPQVHFILGEKIHHHMGLSESNESLGYLKSFVEMYLISNANTAYQVVAPNMYNSTFPYYAALLGNRNYQVITLNE